MTSPYLGAMLAHEFSEKRITYPVAVEPKLDGFRVTFVSGQGYTRNGRTYESFRPFAEAIDGCVPKGVHVDGEVKAANWNETSALLKRIKNVDHERIAREVTVHIFDAFTESTIGAEPYTERRKAVEWIAERLRCYPGLKFVATPSTIVHSRTELDAAFAAALKAGHEGLMVKALDGVYTLKRSWAWMKIKLFRDITVTIKAVTHGWGLCPACMTKERREARAATMDVMGIYDPDDVKPDPDCTECRGAAKGTPRPDLLGALVCVDDAGNEWGVGMGFTANQKREFMSNPPIGRRCDVKIQDEGTLLTETSTTRNDIVARHAVFLRFRDDV